MTTPMQDAFADRRRASRFPVDHDAIFDVIDGQEFKGHIANVSAHGLMLDHVPQLAKGDRITVRLPVVGRIEAFMVWESNGRAGFEFERIIRLPDFMAMLDEMTK